jgi:hypothetical protein
VVAISFPVIFTFVIDVAVLPRTEGRLRQKEYDLRPVLTRKGEQGSVSHATKMNGSPQPHLQH